MGEEVAIYGAGISGMVAGFNLAREGYSVVVREKEPSIGGSPVFNPSTHTTPLDLEETSDYIGLDISAAFQPVSALSIYFHDYKLEFPVYKSYHVERSSRPSSLDSLLYEKCLDAGVRFEFGRPLQREEIPSLEPGTIIACGLNPEAYDYLDIPYLPWYAWMARGEMEYPNYSWMWLDECINEYGYISFCNGIYFNLLFSYGREVSEECLKKYRDFMIRKEELSEDHWDYIGGAVPLAGVDNPRLVREGLIMCGTMSGSMDPLFGFGISGALVSGKVAAMAVSDIDAARTEFQRFNRNFDKVYRFKHELWYELRSRIDLWEETARILGPQRTVGLLLQAMRFGRKNSAIPGFSPLSCH